MFTFLFSFTVSVFLSLALAQDCTRPVKYCNYHADYFPLKLNFEQSTTIRDVKYHGKYVDFTVVSDVTGSPFVNFPQTVFKYRLVQCGCNAIKAPKDRVIVYTNPAGVYVSDGPTLGILEQLIPSLYPLRFSGLAENIYSPIALWRIREKRTTPVSSRDLSPIAKANPFGVSLIGTYSVGNYVEANTSKPFITIGEVSEETLLGRAEYIKLFGLLFHLEATASHRYNAVKSHYNFLKGVVQSNPLPKKPTVFFNYPFTKWSQPGQFQYITSALLDAGADYLFKNDGRLLPQPLTFDQILSDFSDADYLVNSALFPLSNDATLQQYLGSGGDDFQRTVKQLNAFKTGNVWSNTKRISRNKTATDYFESAAFRADLLLRDYIQIVRPDLKIKQPLVYMYKYIN